MEANAIQQWLERDASRNTVDIRRIQGDGSTCTAGFNLTLEYQSIEPAQHRHYRTHFSRSAAGSDGAHGGPPLASFRSVSTNGRIFSVAPLERCIQKTSSPRGHLMSEPAIFLPNFLMLTRWTRMAVCFASYRSHAERTEVHPDGVDNLQQDQ